MSRSIFALLVTMLFVNVSAAEDVVLLNWEDYIPTSVIEKFTAEFGHSVKIQTYDSVDELEALLEQKEAFDVAVFSHQIISKHKAKIAKLQHKLLPNMKYLSEDFLSPPYDANNGYSIPYQWGTTGIGYNKGVVDDSVTSWASIFAASTAIDRIALLNDSREVIGAALMYLGYSVNTTNSDELNKAVNLLSELKERGVKFVGALEGQVALVSGKLDIVHGYNGDMIAAQDENEDLVYTIPTDGCTFWVDTFVINKASSHIEASHAFINFTLSPEIAAEITNSNYYASPVLAAEKFIDPEIISNPAIYPSNEVWEKMQLLRELPAETAAIYAQIWASLKAE